MCDSQLHFTMIEEDNELLKYIDRIFYTYSTTSWFVKDQSSYTECVSYRL